MPNVGPVTFAQLIARFPFGFGRTRRSSAACTPRRRRRGKAAQRNQARRELEALAKIGGRLIASVEPGYPRGLAALDAPPPVISALGHDVLLTREMVAIVGARNASALGRKLAGRLAADLGEAGLAVVSGMARASTTAAHEGSLASGTCAVVAGGIDVIYPPENAGLYERIKAEGIVVSEMPLGQPPKARHFPRRNRIISALSRVWSLSRRRRDRVR